VLAESLAQPRQRSHCKRTLQEDSIIIEAQARFDNMWSEMASKLLTGRLKYSIDKKMLSIINNTLN